MASTGQLMRRLHLSVFADFFWIPIVFFEISIAAIVANIIYLKWNGSDEARCMIGELTLLAFCATSCISSLLPE